MVQDIQDVLDGAKQEILFAFHHSEESAVVDIYVNFYVVVCLVFFECGCMVIEFHCILICT